MLYYHSSLYKYLCNFGEQIYKRGLFLLIFTFPIAFFRSHYGTNAWEDGCFNGGLENHFFARMLLSLFFVLVISSFFLEDLYGLACEGKKRGKKVMMSSHLMLIHSPSCHISKPFLQHFCLTFFFFSSSILHFTRQDIHGKGMAAHLLGSDISLVNLLYALFTEFDLICNVLLSGSSIFFEHDLAFSSPALST